MTPAKTDLPLGARFVPGVDLMLWVRLILAAGAVVFTVVVLHGI